MCSLVADPRDLLPYLNQLLPHLRKAVCDPIPDVRACASKALGSLVRGLGIDAQPDLLPWLVATLQSETSTVERSGAAQALVEVLTALGEPTLSTTLASLLPLSSSPKPAPREGFLWVVVFLPASMGHAFARFVPRLFPIVLNGIADDSDLVRDVSARCGKTIVTAHGKTDPGLVVPCLEAGLQNASWRIRQASVSLTGQLLTEIAGMPLPTVVAGNTVAAAPGAGGASMRHGGGGGGDSDDDDEDGDGDSSDGDDQDDDADLAGLANFKGGHAADDGGADDDGGAAAGKGKGKGGADGGGGGTDAAAAAASKFLDRKGKPGGGDDDDKQQHQQQRAQKQAFFKSKSPSHAAQHEDHAEQKAKAKAANAEGKRVKGQRGAVDADDRLPMAKKSNKLRQPSEAKLAQLAAQGQIVGLGGPASSAASDAALLPSMDVASQAQVRVLGMEMRNRIMASMYLARSDTSGVVRQGALGVWKATVANTPRTLREVLHCLMNLIITDLARTGNDSYGEERRLVSGRCLGDIVRKLADRVLPEIVPLLRRGLASDSASLRTGVCLGLTEVIDAAPSKSSIVAYTHLLIPALRDAICDADGRVRDAASRAFSSLQRVVGSSAVTDSVIPSLLAALQSDDADDRERAVAGLQNIVSGGGSGGRMNAGAGGSGTVLPTLLPQLLSAPIDVPRARALAAVCTTASSVLHYHILTILPPIVACLAGDEPGCTASDRTPEAVTARAGSDLGIALCSILPCAAESGVAWCLQETCKYLAAGTEGGGIGAATSAAAMAAAPKRQAAAHLLKAFIANPSSPSYTSQVPVLLKELVNRLGDACPGPLAASWDALSALVNAVVTSAPDEAAGYIDFARQCVSGVVSDVVMASSSAKSKLAASIAATSAAAAARLPGLCLPKGIDCLLPLYQRALLAGTTDQREAAAIGIRELITASSPDALKPLWVKITGPLIRIVAESKVFPWGVKAAIHATLGAIITAGGAALKPFQPQLQASFVKALSDPVAAVRREGGRSLGLLMPLASRVDPLITELSNSISNLYLGGFGGGSGEVGVCLSLLSALRNVLFVGGDKATPVGRSKAVDVLLPLVRYGCISGGGGGGEDARGDGEEADEEDGSDMDGHGAELRTAAGGALGAALRHADRETIDRVVPLVMIKASSGKGGAAVTAAGGAAACSLPPGRHGKCAAVNGILLYGPAALTGGLATAASAAAAASAPSTDYMPALAAHLKAASTDASTGIREAAAIGCGWALSHGGRGSGSGGHGAAADGSGAPATPATAASATSVLDVHPAPSDFTSPAGAATAPVYLTASPALTPVLASLLTDPSPDVRKRALNAARRFARHGYPAIFAHAGAPIATLLPLIAGVVNRDTPNAVLRYEADRALSYWLGLKASDSNGNPGGDQKDKVLGVLSGAASADATAAGRFLNEYVRRGGSLRRHADEPASDEEDDEE